MIRLTGVRAVPILGLAAVLLATSPAAASVPPFPLPEGCSITTVAGAETLICVPDGWNRRLVVFAHGYVAPDEPVEIPWAQLQIDGTTIPDLVTGLRFAFATTSYRRNGLAVLEGVQDVRELVAAFARGAWGGPDYVYLVGASEGALVTTLAVEQYPGEFSGGLATCGPVGNFRGQVNYWGDFRVLFDYYFPRMLPPSAVNVPQDVRDRWDTYYAPLIGAAVASRPAALDALLRVSRAPFDPGRPESKVETVLGLLWYNVFATMDGISTLGGQPFDNTTRFYTGSGHDFLLNLRVGRYRASAQALMEIEANYQTSGRLARPLVTLHTTGDPIVPYWHEPLYSLKALLGGSGLLHTNLPVFRYGHCSFEPAEALVGLGLLVLKAEGRGLQNAERVLTTESSRERYRSLSGANLLRR
jgi:hypothetical protein